MKIILKIIFAMMACAVTFTACSNDDDIFENISSVQPAVSMLKPMTFTVTQEEQEGTQRAAFDATDAKKIDWTAGDIISIFDGVKGAGNHFDHDFTLIAGGGTTSGTFTGEAAADAAVYYALYPAMSSILDKSALTEEEAKATFEDPDNWSLYEQDYEMCKENYESEIAGRYECAIKYITKGKEGIFYDYLSGKEVVKEMSGVQLSGDKFENVVLPAEQTAVAGSADPMAVLMIAKSEDGSTLAFKNICAYVKVKPMFDCYAIAIRSNGVESLAGIMTVDYNNGNPTTTVTANGTNAVCLNGTITAGNTYYIAVRPEVLNSGFIIEFLTKSKSYYYGRSSSKVLSMARNKVINLGTFETSGTWTYNNLPTSGSDNNGRNWQLATPTLRLATDSPINDVVTYTDGNVLGKWGSNWILPTVGDMQPIENSRSSGAGVLRYVVSFSNIPASNEKHIIWLSGQQDDYTQNSFTIDDFTISTLSPAISAAIMYKYVGE